MTAVATPPKSAPSPAPRESLMYGQLIRLPLAQLVESPWNPRKHFDPAKLAETAESLRTNGQLTPIIVRPWKGASGKFEIGAGHRRFRAAPQAGLDSLLAVVRDLDDVAFLELLTIENKQREDVTPLDEAAGFKLLMEKARYDVQKLADRVGLSKEYVYGRLKLLQLIPELRKYLEEGVISAGHGVLLARLTPTDQRRVMGNPSRMNRYGYNDGTGLFQPDHADHDPNQPGLDLKQPIKARSVRELATYINDHVRFKPEENDLPNLFPAAQAALEEAKGDDLTPVYISYDHQLKHDAKDHKVRTYGVMSWRRADGQQDHDGGKKSKTCAWSRVGIVAAGRHRGDAFRVCVNRDKCEVHFPEAARARARRAKADATARGPAPRKDAPDESPVPRGPTPAQIRANRLDRARGDAREQVFAGHKAEFVKGALARAAQLKSLPDAVVMAIVSGDFFPDLSDGTEDYDKVQDLVQPELPGAWTGKGSFARPRNAAAARADIGLTLFLALDTSKLDEAIDKEVDVIAAKVVAAEEAKEKAAVAKAKAGKKPAPKKAKKGGR